MSEQQSSPSPGAATATATPASDDDARRPSVISPVPLGVVGVVVVAIALVYLVGQRSTDLVTQSVVTGLLLGGVYALVSVGLTLIFGVLGIVTLGLGWMLYAFLLPGVALLYVAFTLGGSAQSTPGMRLFGVRLSRLDGGRIDPAYAVLHAVLFWASCSVLTPFVLLMALFTRRKQMLHDYLLGTVAVRRGL